MTLTKRFWMLLLVLTIGVTGSVLIAHSFHSNPVYLEFPEGENYESLWKEVKELEEKGLVKSAQEKVLIIQKLAKAADNVPQQIKSLIHLITYFEQIEDNPESGMINLVRSEMASAKFPLKPIYQSMLGQLYFMHYNMNRWSISGRTPIYGEIPEDIDKWDIKTIAEQSAGLYLASVSQTEKLKQVKIGLIDEVLVKGEGAELVRPTLYDFLAHRAINFFSAGFPELPVPPFQYQLDDSQLFSPWKQFVSLKFETKDTASSKLKALKLFQSLIQLSYDRENLAAAVDVDLHRLMWLRREATVLNKDSLYLAALEDLSQSVGDVEESVQIHLARANFYLDKSGQYSPLGEQKGKFGNKKAMEICEAMLAKYPKSKYTNNFRNIQIRIKTKSLEIAGEMIWPKDAKGLIHLKYTNVNKVYFRVVKEPKELPGDESKQLPVILAAPKAVPDFSYSLPDDKLFNQQSTEIPVPALDFGRYFIVVSNSERFDKNAIVYTGQFFVSNIAFSSRQMQSGAVEVLVNDRTSGRPLTGVIVNVHTSKYDYQKREYITQKIGTATTDAKGIANIKASSKGGQSILFSFINGEDKLKEVGGVYQSYYSDSNNEARYRTVFFSDRAIYRPGQTIHFKGIVLEEKDGKSRLVKNYNAKVEFKDANYQEVASLNLRTNEFGSFAGTFTIPVGGNTGQMRLMEEYGQHYFQVEEYKRPKFEVNFDPVKGSFQLGSKVTVSGQAKAYAGSNIDGATVAYRVERTARFPWFGWWYRSAFPSSRSMEITAGTTKTDASGKFSVDFTAISDKALSKESKPVFNYTVYADITDITGETQSQSISVSVGYIALNASIPVPEINQAGKMGKLPIITENLNGEFEPAKGKIVIHKLEEPQRIYRSKLIGKPEKQIIKESTYRNDFPYELYGDENDITKWNREKQVFSTQFDTEKQDSISFSGNASWPEGRYELVLTTQDKFGNSVEIKNYFTLYQPKQPKTDLKLGHWVEMDKGTYKPGEKAEILFGTGHKDLNILYEIEHEGEIVSREWVNLSREKRVFTIPIEEKHRGNFFAHFTYVKNGRKEHITQAILVPWSNKRLSIEYETFRDKLLPGQKEEWRLKIKGPDGEKVASEMVAGMYDASLDAFRQNSWMLNTWKMDWTRIRWDDAGSYRLFYPSLRTYSQAPYLEAFYQQYSYLNWRIAGGRFRFGELARNQIFSNGFDETGKIIRYEPLPGVRSGIDGLDSFALSEESKNLETATLAFAAPDQEQFDESTIEAGNRSQKLGKIKIRTNLNETAFFYPHLMTDEEGSIVISFTIPEALTRWKLMTLAHTKDLQIGTSEKEIVTQKDLMVMPVPPRFFREGDRMLFTAKVSNLSDKDLSGTAEIELLDALTMQPLNAAFGIKENQQAFAAKKGQSAPLAWEIVVPEGLQAVTWRVKARAGNFTDGEESSLPVLTNRMLVTESMPLPVRAGQTRSFTFDKLKNHQSSTLKHHRYTLEFTSNPAWYAIQSLSYLMEYPYECTEQIFSRYYANSLAASVANSSPRIKAVFNSWKQPDSEALLSNLEKNQELKSLLLEETPWVMQAQNESERKKRLGLLFDLNKMGNELAQARKQLVDRQSSNGGFSWFPGMPDSRYITQYLVSGFGHLDRLGVEDISQDNRIKAMMEKAIRYLDERILEDYNDLKKSNIDMEEMHINSTQIQYLYGRSFFPQISLKGPHKKAHQYYTDQAEKYWLKTDKYMQGMIALALFRMDKKAVPAAIVASLKEFAVQDDEMGMYWKANRGWFWYQADIERQALLIEVFDEVANDQVSVEEMKLWLLKQKQTQDWKTTRATAEACYALLLRGTDILAESELAEVTIGGEKVEIEADTKVEAGTGYFKKTWTANEITPKMANVKVKNPNKVAAWGSVYWQYFEQLDKITPHETPLAIKKDLFLQKNSATGPQLHRITAATPLKPGDLVKVRIEITVDREMEYVHLKDMRAAGFEPVNVISQYKWQDGLGYYESTRDASTNFFMGRLPKGTFVFEYPLRVTYPGDFSNGVTTMQCMYAPEFTTHSEGIRVKIGQ